MAEIKDRIIVALDVDTKKKALDLFDLLAPHVGFFKIGLELLNAVGIEIVKKISERGRVFLDGKFNDIPNTIRGACRAATRSGARMMNVHTMGGEEMMNAAAESVSQEAVTLGIERPVVLGVTILTSIDRKIMNEQLRIEGEVKEQVVHLARLATHAGLDGVIASPLEIEPIRDAIPREMLVVTPGVRPMWAEADDQKRIMEPGEAIRKGASMIVIGRPVTDPPREIGTPAAAAILVTKEIEAALKQGEPNG